MTPSNFTDFIKTQALALGFQHVGVMPAGAFEHGEEHALSEWLAAGLHADMQWMENYLELRQQPGSLMDGAKSVVCVAVNYYAPDDYDADDPTALKIAKYARGADYHKLLRKRLKKLLTLIQQEAERCGLPPVHGRPVTDSAPQMERPMARRAGLGWVGKNGNLITPTLGSFVFLGELMLDVALDYDAPFVTNHCGTCTRCVTACPTTAITVNDLGHGVVDANRCIAYWTIESDADRFPVDIRDNLNGWIFGCDICQDVCPWNQKFAVANTDPAFQPRSQWRTPEAEMILNWDDAAFTAHTEASAIRRTGLSGLQRNVREAMAGTE
ncbi:MAG: tRNA epoxyqueuosine(34) reductase QueG [Candidatus Melainabacteria bacterium]